MTVSKPFVSGADGLISRFIDNEDGTITVASRQQCESNILEANKKLYTLNDGYTPDREMQRLASIPIALINYWRDVEGWDPLLPENNAKLMAKLDDPDMRFLRTAPGRIGKRSRHI